MDFARNNSRLRCYVLAALGFLVTFVTAETYTINTGSGGSFGSNAVSRRVVITSSTGSGVVGVMEFSVTSGTSGFNTYGSTYYPQKQTAYQAGGSIPTGGSPVPHYFSKTTQTVWYRWSTSGTVYHFEWDLPDTTLNFVRQTPYGEGSSMVKAIPPFEITLTPGSGAQLVTSSEAIPPKIYKDGVLFFDNLTGLDQIVKIGSEEILLKPGYNSFPYYGEVGVDGFPKGLPVGMNMALVDGPGGLPIFTGRLGLSVEGVPTWQTPPSPVSALASASGATIKIPSGTTPGVTDYVALPPGMTKGSNVPVPPGMIGNPPSGVTPGSSGSLNNGVISGGIAYLPPNVSAGTVKGNTPGGTAPVSDPVAGTGSNPTQSGTGQQGLDGTYIPGASMAGMDESARAEGKAAANAIVAQGKASADGITAKGQAIMSSDKSFWIAPSESLFSGHDSSWMSMSLPIGTSTVDITVPPNWISLLREICLWVVKVAFVVSVLKLVMK